LFFLMMMMLMRDQLASPIPHLTVPAPPKKPAASAVD
jgi:hypothetical protein